MKNLRKLEHRDSHDIIYVKNMCVRKEIHLSQLPFLYQINFTILNFLHIRCKTHLIEIKLLRYI